MAKQNLWTREELILAFNLYFKIAFGRTHSGNPKVIELANLIGRTPSSIVMRLANFASIDPYHQQRGIVGLKNGMNQVQPIWDEFFNNKEELIFLSEQILAERENIPIEKKYKIILPELEGRDVIREIKTRVNQSVFREMVLSNYDNKCAITGIDIYQLLAASHIIPWAKNKSERLNPENGICLSPLYDKAFDKGLIGIRTDCKIILSKNLKAKENNQFYKDYFASVENLKISNALSYAPRKEFLQYHLDTIFEK